MYATGVWRGFLVRKQRGTPLRYLAPPLLVLTVAVELAAEAVHIRPLRHVRTLTRTATAAYVGAIIAAGFGHLGGDTLRDRALNPIVLATLHLAWGVGFLKGLTGAGTETRDRSRISG
jgi:hypothetical protein